MQPWKCKGRGPQPRPSHDAQGAFLTDRAATVQSSLLLFGESHGDGQSGSTRLQVFTTEEEGRGAVTVGEETEVTDLDEARGQDVKQEAADELCRLEGHHLDAVAIFRVSPAKADPIVGQAHQSAVGDSDAVGVAGEILQYLFWTPKGRFGVDHPLFG